jgi:hypothetical protein
MAAADPLQSIQVSLGAEPVLPPFVEDAEQALAYGIAAGLRPAGALDGFGVGVQRLGAQTLDDLWDCGHPIASQLEHLPEPKSARCGRGAHLVCRASRPRAGREEPLALSTALFLHHQ